MSGRQEPSALLEPQVRLMLRAALLIFVYTVSVGILNGLDVIDFPRSLLLAHIHGGTLGWMTLGILAATLWLFADGAGPSRSSEVLPFVHARSCPSNRLAPPLVSLTLYGDAEGSIVIAEPAGEARMLSPTRDRDHNMPVVCVTDAIVVVR